jgi:hypothetical protein
MPRAHVIGVRLSAEEYHRLSAAAAAGGARPGTLARRLIRDQLAGAPAAAGTRCPPAAAASAGDPLVRTVATRISLAECDDLRERATAAGLAVGSFLRLLLRGLPPAPRRPLTRSAIVALNRVGNNLNQLTRLAHGGVLMPTDLFATLRAVHQEVRALREALEGEP